MNIVNKQYEHYVKCETDININNNEEFNVYIVYFINCMTNINYMSWLENQINLVKNFNGTIYIVATIPPEDEALFRQLTLNLFSNINLNIECYYENEFEYRGILKVWQLGQMHNTKNDIILYFHSKGVTHFPNYESNAHDNYNIILKDINKIKEIFTIFPKIDKIGFCNSNLGWVWYNFWYARGSYINNVETPIKTERRHYYEDWLGRQLYNNQDKFCEQERCYSIYNTCSRNCYGFHTDKHTIANIGSYYDAGNDKWVDTP